MTSVDPSGLFDDWLEIVEPKSNPIVMLISSFFDESYDGDLLCVAGYSFIPSNLRKMKTAWEKLLRRFELPYFRMSACNARQHPFEHLTNDECIEAATIAIDSINEFALDGQAVTIDPKAFASSYFKNSVVKNPYQYCAWQIIAGSRQCVEGKHPQSSHAYVFESGFRDEKSANSLMNKIFARENLRDLYAYASHSFVDKRISLPTQAADLLAWQWYKDRKRRRNGATKCRGDLARLLEAGKHTVMHIEKDQIEDILSGLAKHFPM